ncbi:conserved hypothetical protein [uncultured Stenotrophomonas sp.]|uniref:Sulfotransferase family protein n=1 Tax=uncultured Stenotrophomonas sp. TaxID=165438 RepID=A0A1Y5Q457_9GAMM|nr:conserved hypothetical protein [uncultured Stenotrophomonas sp.]
MSPQVVDSSILPAMIVSLHLPKTAGTSFGAALERHFGAALLRDYADLPLHVEPAVRNAAALRASLAQADLDAPPPACIHGHFLPVKYLLHAQRHGARFVTWMRHPVERLLSHYFFWQRTPPSSPAQRLHCRMHEEGWSLETFCLAPELQDAYSQFLWAFPLEYFDFIGITEHYDADFALFSRRYLGSEAAPARMNAAPASGQGRHQLDPALRRRIEAFHARDLALYGRALQLRLLRTEARP